MSESINIHEAKTQLSKLLSRVGLGIVAINLGHFSRTYLPMTSPR